jgi:hypothetical protein
MVMGGSKGWVLATAWPHAREEGMNERHGGNAGPQKRSRQPAIGATKAETLFNVSQEQPGNDAFALGHVQ